MVSRNILPSLTSGDKIPIVTPVLETHFACLRYDPLPKAMKKSKAPSWFYASHTGESMMLPDVHKPALKSEHTKDFHTEMERLDRIQEWLQSSVMSSVETVTKGAKSSSIEQHQNNHNNSNNTNINKMKVSKRNRGSSNHQDPKTISAPLPRINAKEKTVIESFDPNFNSKFPKLGSIMTVSDDPEIIGRRLSVKTRDNDWRKKRSAVSLSLSSDKTNKTSGHRTNKDSEFYPAKILPSELTASEYEKRRTKTFYGLDSSFSATNTSEHPLKRKGGPIQRPHSPMADLYVRQRTRYGDTMMHAKSPSKAFSDQQGKTYTLHAKLKDMLLER